MVYSLQKGCRFLFSGPPPRAPNDGATYFQLPELGKVYCHSREGKPRTCPSSLRETVVHLFRLRCLTCADAAILLSIRSGEARSAA